MFVSLNIAQAVNREPWMIRHGAAGYRNRGRSRYIASGTPGIRQPDYTRYVSFLPVPAGADAAAPHAASQIMRSPRGD